MVVEHCGLADIAHVSDTLDSRLPDNILVNGNFIVPQFAFGFGRHHVTELVPDESQDELCLVHIVKDGPKNVNKKDCLFFIDIGQRGLGISIGNCPLFQYLVIQCTGKEIGM